MSRARMIDVARAVEELPGPQARRPGSRPRCARCSTARTRPSRRVEELSFRHWRGRARGLPGPQRRRQDDDPEDARRAAAPDRRAGPGRRPRAPHARAAFLKRITLVMGQKQQLLWDLPPVRDLRAEPRHLRHAARAVRGDARASWSSCWSSATSISKPTRQLSLGERMKCELAAALLHRPQGAVPRRADHRPRRVDAGARCATFIRDYNERYGATVMLTSHYMDDVAALCPRVDRHRQGAPLYDGDLQRAGAPRSAPRSASPFGCRRRSTARCSSSWARSVVARRRAGGAAGARRRR